MEKRRESPRMMRPKDTSTHNPPHESLQNGFAPFTLLLKKKAFTTSLKRVHLDEFIPFLQKIKQILGFKNQSLKHFKELEVFFKPVCDTGLFSKDFQGVNLSNERLKTQYLFLLQTEDTPSSAFLSVLESIIEDCRLTILSTLSSSQAQGEDEKIIATLSAGDKQKISSNHFSFY